MKIVYAFDDENIIKSIHEKIKDEDINYITCSSKLEVFYEIMNDDVDCVVIMENNVRNGLPWTAYEMARLIDFKDVHIVPIIKSEHLGLEFVKILYAAGITSAVTDGSNLSDIAALIKNKRTREDALDYYRLNDENDPDKRYIELNTVPKDVFNEIDGSLSAAGNNNEMIKLFDELCQGLSEKQINDLLSKKISPEKREIIRKSKTYKAMNKSQKSKDSSSHIPESFKTLNNHGKKIHILYAFDNEELKKFVDDKLMERGYDVYSNVEYTKKGILNYITRHPDVDTIVTIEHLERKGPFTSQEISEITKISDANIIICIDASQRGNDYMLKLYAEGVTSAFLGTPKTQRIIDLIINKRCRYEARQYYELEQGHDEKFVFSDGIKKDAIKFIENRSLDFDSKVSFLQELFSRMQLNEIIQLSNDEIKEQATEAGLINNKKKGIGVIAPFFMKSEKETKSEDTDGRKTKVEKQLGRRIGEETPMHKENRVMTAEQEGTQEVSGSSVDERGFNGAKPETGKTNAADNTEGEPEEVKPQNKASDTNSKPVEIRNEETAGTVGQVRVAESTKKPNPGGERKANPAKVKESVDPVRHKPAEHRNEIREPLVFTDESENKGINAGKNIKIGKKHIAIVVVAAVALLGGTMVLAASLKNKTKPISETMYNGDNVVVQGGIVGDNDIEVDSQTAITPETESMVIETTQQATEETTVKKTTKTAKKRKKNTKSTKVVTGGTNQGDVSGGSSRTNKVPETKKQQTVVKKEPAKKKNTKPSKKPKKVVNNTVPAQHQNTSELGYNGTQIIINTVSNAISGNINTNMQNLAIYMAANGRSDAQNTINSLCKNTTIKVTSRTATATARSSAQDDILIAAEKLADSLRGSANKFGIGVKVTYVGGKFKVKVVVAIQTN